MLYEKIKQVSLDDVYNYYVERKDDMLVQKCFRAALNSLTRLGQGSEAERKLRRVFGYGVYFKYSMFRTTPFEREILKLSENNDVAGIVSKFNGQAFHDQDIASVLIKHQHVQTVQRLMLNGVFDDMSIFSKGVLLRDAFETHNDEVCEIALNLFDITAHDNFTGLNNSSWALSTAYSTGNVKIFERLLSIEGAFEHVYPFQFTITTGIWPILFKPELLKNQWSDDFLDSIRITDDGYVLRTFVGDEKHFSF